jgi:hypothetical protein
VPPGAAVPPLREVCVRFGRWGDPMTLYPILQRCPGLISVDLTDVLPSTCTWSARAEEAEEVATLLARGDPRPRVPPGVGGGRWGGRGRGRGVGRGRGPGPEPVGGRGLGRTRVIVMSSEDDIVRRRPPDSCNSISDFASVTSCFFTACLNAALASSINFL